MMITKNTWNQMIYVVSLLSLTLLTPALAGADLIAYWDFEGGAGTELLDKSGSTTAHDLTAVDDASVGVDTGRTAVMLDGSLDCFC